MSAIDKTGWTVYEPVLCECVDTRGATISTAGGNKFVFILDLIALESEIVLTKYFNVTKTLKGDYSVKHNSDFAKLYRITIGANPKARYTRADQLVRHLKGQQFIAEYTDASTKHIAHYFKVIQLVPVEPIITSEWFVTGMLKAKRRSQRYNKVSNHKVKKDKQTIGNELAIVKQKTGNELAMGNPVNQHLNWALDRVSIPHTSLKHDMEPLPHSDTPDREYKTTVKTVNGANIYHYYRQPSETKVEYHDRVIDESFSSYGELAGG